MKPGDFLLGVLDFFAVLLPGGLATWLVLQYVPASTVRQALAVGLDAPPAAPDRVALGLAWLVASWVLGHFVFMLGSHLDGPYDRWRKRTVPKDADTTYLAANDVRARRTPSIALPAGASGLSTFKWARTYLQVRHPAARQEIDRLEADSKFFRGLVVVASAAALHAVWTSHAWAALACVGVAWLSWRRFREQRWKMTELAYAAVVIIEALEPLPPRNA